WWVTATGDCTGDGIPDVITAAETVNVVPTLGDGSSHWRTANGYVLMAVAAADFDSDGRLDAATADWDTGTVSVLRGNGDGTLKPAESFATGAAPVSLAVEDFNGDGRPDVAVANSGSNTRSVLLNDRARPNQNLPGLRIYR